MDAWALHVLPEYWNGTFFKRKSLKALGLKIQLEHPYGYSFPTSEPAHDKFVLIDVTGIHEITLSFCRCDSRVGHEHQLLRACWWPATAKDPQTCTTFTMIQLFQLLNFKDTADDEARGKGTCPTGIAGTAQGELVLNCCACPQPGINLPASWDTINWAEMPEDLRYKYFLFIAQDCNVQLINRNISSEAKDPILHDGMGHFVNYAKHSAWLCDHVSEEEISTCSGFQAMFLANRKRVKGLRTPRSIENIRERIERATLWSGGWSRSKGIKPCCGFKDTNTSKKLDEKFMRTYGLSHVLSPEMMYLWLETSGVTEMPDSQYFGPSWAASEHLAVKPKCNTPGASDRWSRMRFQIIIYM
ncbi:hypothetical protein B0H17DRAFT_1150070 [Mycena rosella]|uniref:CxC2-like cysteine cluster KDZ transposase-associated domain-containing protein n=1 Tax=Mycena rosella TaxID=1033263 RepID=A0AAD7FM47_MYCRO|nr:hypothetical protein B0H17DRAFT_1150070 [Mycena rosella]